MKLKDFVNLMKCDIVSILHKKDYAGGTYDKWVGTFARDTIAEAYSRYEDAEITSFEIGEDDDGGPYVKVFVK